MTNHTGRLILTPEDAWAVPDRARLLSGLTAAGFLGAPLPDRPHAFAMGPDLPALLIFAGCAVTFRPASGAAPDARSGLARDARSGLASGGAASEAARSDAANWASSDADRLDPQAAPFCHLILPPPAARPRPGLGRNTRPPRCPACRARLAEWRAAAAVWDAWSNRAGDAGSRETDRPDLLEYAGSLAEAGKPRLSQEVDPFLDATDSAFDAAAEAGHRDVPAWTCPACGATAPPWRWDWKLQGGGGRVFVRVEEVFPGEAAPDPRLFALLLESSGLSWRYFHVQDEALVAPNLAGS